MSYYQTQLNNKQVQEIFIKEFNKALAQFPKAEIIPAKLDVWNRNNEFTNMEQLLRINGQYYLIALETTQIKKYDEGYTVVCNRQVKIWHVEGINQSDIFDRTVYIGPSDHGPIVYEGKKIYCCPKASFARRRGFDNFETSIWYFTDFETPNEIMRKISWRITNNVANAPIITIRLKRTPFRGFKKNVVYKRYSQYRWTLTNKNGREADEYDLIK